MTDKVLEHLGETKLELGPAAARGALWRLDRDEDSVAWLVLDAIGAGTNTVSRETLVALGEKLDQIEATVPSALVLRSAKKPGFIAGADIRQFQSARKDRQSEAGTIADQLRAGHEIFDRIEALDCPTIAVIHGYALGAGFEIALALDYRIAIEGAYFGFPEIRLGLHPGLGGTFRLPELIDPIAAMTMMLTGKPAYADKALELGIVDVVTTERHVRNAVRTLVDRGKKPKRSGIKHRALDIDAMRAIAARRMRSQTEKQAPVEHYPAPHALIDLWEQQGDNRSGMQTGEIESFATLLGSDTAQNLIRAFFLHETLKGGTGETSKIRHVHVAGAGVMGAGIAAWCAIKGLRVSLYDVEEEALGRALVSAGKMCDAAHLSAIEKRDALDRLMPDPRGYGVSRCDLVIEAGPEDPELKRKIYGELEQRMREETILATNTSSLSLEDLGAKLDRPQRFAGLHFFNPVAKMELVEVVSHGNSDPSVVETLRDFAGAISRLPAPVRDYPGFLVNRALTPYLLEAMVMIDEGAEKEQIDACAEEFGMPVGPVELADRIGLDVCLSVSRSLRGRLPGVVPEVPDWYEQMVERGERGEKSGKGFYEWKKGRPRKKKIEATFPADMQDRLILPLLNACMECLRKDIVADKETLDAAMIFGTGFAPFRGGPMHYARARGYQQIANTLSKLADTHGERFTPDEGWSA